MDWAPRLIIDKYKLITMGKRANSKFMTTTYSNKTVRLTSFKVIITVSLFME